MKFSPRAKKFFEQFIFYLKIAIVAAGLVVFIRGFLFVPVTIDGNSMENTLMTGDEMVMEKFSKIRRFDIVVIERPNNEILVKRVIGLPHDSLKVVNNQLYINDKRQEEPFLKKNLKNYHSLTPFTNDFELKGLIGKEKLGKDEYFVMGDNRVESRDSRTFGVVKEREILGKGLFVYYPFDELKWLR
ncbi:signal peptidase I [Pilibacter termitis]|jgi:signal peptidase I|uniref:Signal peptidase I n=1 Tax=Pilibacter termitis TaxID=263852 RepID=A0A1T4KRL7_9ENTE|nr:signal peptidase I [Pilibacter termitis]SJZ44977.1 signal peptidase I [Pilibacter termitis]